MKKTFIIIFLFFPIILSANFYGEIWSGIQLNYPTSSSVASAIGRLRLGSIFTTKNSNIKLHIRCASAYGKAYFGSTSLMVPANDIASDSKEFVIDEAFFSFKSKNILILIGLIDPAGFDHNGSGFFNTIFTGNENNGFFSTHFLKLFANNGIDQFKYQSIPALFFYLKIIKNIIFKTGITFGLAEKHLFLRNTMPIEISFKTSSLHISFNVGFGDADSSMVHKISPSLGLIIEKKLFYDFCIFTKYSCVEKDIKTFRTPDIEITNNYIVAKEFSPFKQHFSTGIVKQNENFGIGIGYSVLKQFENRIPEKVIEIFVRTKVFDIFDLSPDFQYIFNPNGSSEYKYMWIAGLRVFYLFEFI